VRPKRAREAYAKALEFDGEDPEALYWCRGLAEALFTDIIGAASDYFDLAPSRDNDALLGRGATGLQLLIKQARYERMQDGQVQRASGECVMSDL
jgi:hypothetical protein